MDVIDRIGAVQTAAMDRPMQEIRIDSVAVSRA